MVDVRGDGGLRLVPELEKQVGALLPYGGFAVTPLPGSPSMPKGLTDRLFLDVPFCYEHVRWQVVYQRVGAAWVPDVLFSDDFQPLLPLGSPAAQEVAQLLASWSGANERCMVELVRKLLQRYGVFQAERVRMVAATDPRLQFELDTVPLDSLSQMMLVQSRDGLPERVVFVVPLAEVRLAGLATALAAALGGPLSPGQLERLQRAVRAKFTFDMSSGACCAKPEIYVHVPDEVLDITGPPKLPAWSEGMCIMEYAPQVAEAIQAQVDASAGAADQRGALLAALSEHYGYPLEVDEASSRTACYRGEFEEVPFILIVDIPTAFPQEQPRLTIQGAEGREVARFSSYGWSPRWSGAEAADRIVRFLNSELLRLQPALVLQSDAGE